MTRRPEHDPVARGLAEARMRGPVVGPDVRLDLDDPAGTTAGLVVAHQPRADERARGLQRRPGEDGAIEGAQASG